MFPYFLFALLALSTVDGRVIPRATPPPGWDTQRLEPYDTFNCRYLALQCEYKYNTDFYNSCCYPLSVNETITSRPADCQMPSNTTCVNGNPILANDSNITSSAPTISPSPINLSPLPTTTDDGCSESAPSTPSMTPLPTFASSPPGLAAVPTPTSPDDAPLVSASPSPTVTGDDGCGGGEETSTPSLAPTISSPAVLAPSPTTTNTDDGCGDETSFASSAAPTTSPTPLASPTTTSTPSPFPTTSTPSTAPTTTTAPINVAPPPAKTSSPTPTTTSSTPAAPSSTGASSDSSNGPFTDGVATYFYQGGNPGACGQVHQDTDYICAMDQARYGGSGNASPLCGQQVQITNLNNGQTVTVTIADDCPTCDNANSIDLSVAAFQAISDLSVGEVPISWVFLN